MLLVASHGKLASRSGRPAHARRWTPMTAASSARAWTSAALVSVGVSGREAGCARASHRSEHNATVNQPAGLENAKHGFISEVSASQSI
jgi:hypothetical protein